jgi:glycosyltransferase involved in cell wall biosynthesis
VSRLRSVLGAVDARQSFKNMNVLFVHNNFPAQFKHIAARLHREGVGKLAAIGAESSTQVDGVDLRRYKSSGSHVETHNFARRFDSECRRAEQVMFAAARLKGDGFRPDLIVAHCGWGETLPLRSVFPEARLAVYCEFYYRPIGQDVGFEDEIGKFGIDGLVGLNAKNASTLIALAECDVGISPTPWQKSTFPPEFQPKIHIAHEGIDTRWIAPDATAIFEAPGAPRLSRDDEVVTYFTRGMEPMRGFHIFMRAIPQILNRRPRAQVVLVGGEEAAYGNPAPDGGDWKSFCLREMLPRLDMSRIHFVEHLPHPLLRKLMQVSTVHVYLTYPFVLSWSCMEAMSAGCAIVGSDTRPVRDVIVDDENGVLTPFHDHEALAEAICDLAGDAARRRRLGRSAREAALAAFDIEDCVDRTLKVLGVDLAAKSSEGEILRQAVSLVPAAVGE